MAANLEANKKLPEGDFYPAVQKPVSDAQHVLGSLIKVERRQMLNFRQYMLLDASAFWNASVL